MSSGHPRTRFLGALGLFAVLSLGVLLSGCGSEDDERPNQWSFIYPAIIEPSCATASCHSDFTRRAGVNFGYSDEAYFQMTQRHFVVMCADPNDAACLARAVNDSEVIYLMRAQGAKRMPPDFALPDADINLIASWIANGAKND
jgi:hypothetical protein